MDEWLPQRHLTRFVIEVVDELDLAEMVKSHGGSGSASPIRRQVRSRALWPDPSRPPRWARANDDQTYRLAKLVDAFSFPCGIPKNYRIYDGSDE